MSHVNQTLPRYAPTQHFSFSKIGGGGRIKRIINKYQEISKIPTLTSHKNSLQNAIKVGLFLLSSLTILH